MAMVLIIHVGFIGIGIPTEQDIQNAPFPTFNRFLFNNLSIVAVDVFVMISGWFGIHPKFKSATNFLFQVFFFSIIVYSVLIILKVRTINISDLKGLFLFNNGYWFVKSYIFLYIFSPVLNAFSDTVTKKQLKLFLVFFFVFQTLYGFILCYPHEQYLNGGSPISFMGLYLLARYCRIYHIYEKISTKKSLLFVYLFVALITSLCCFFVGLFHINQVFYDAIVGWSKSYVSPINIFSALCLLLLFSKMSFNNSVINWIAKSCFGVYLLQENIMLCNYFYNYSKYLFYRNFGVGVFLKLTILVVSTYILAIIIDKIRIIIWNFIYNKLYKSKF